MKGENAMTVQYDTLEALVGVTKNAPIEWQE